MADKPTITRYRFTLVTTDKPKDWTLHAVIKRHFRAYDARNLNAALRQLAKNLMTEFGLVDTYKVKPLGRSGYQINIGNVLVVKFSWSWYGFVLPITEPVSSTNDYAANREVPLEVSTRYIRRFGGFHEKYWVDHDKDHVLAKCRLLTKAEKKVAEVYIPTKPLPKSTLAGFLISLALEGETEYVGF